MTIPVGNGRSQIVEAVLYSMLLPCAPKVWVITKRHIFVPALKMERKRHEKSISRVLEGLNHIIKRIRRAVSML
jgi:hypothetical protein